MKKLTTHNDVPEVPIKETPIIELKSNPKALFFKMVSEHINYTKFLDKIDEVATQYDKEELKDPRNAAVTLSATKQGLDQYQMLMNLDIKDNKPSDVIDVNEDEIDEYLKNIPEYLSLADKSGSKQA